MDKNTVIGLSLIFVIFLGWMYVMQPSPEEIERIKRENALRDSLKQIETEEVLTSPSLISQSEEDLDDSVGESKTKMGDFVQNAYSDTVFIRVETDVFDFTFSNLGAGPVEAYLKQFKRWDDEPVQLINDTSRSAYSLGFMSTQNYEIETQQILFIPKTELPLIQVKGDEKTTLVYELPVSEGVLRYTYTFFGNQNFINLQIQFDGVSNSIASRKVDFTFNGGLNTTEKSRSIEAKESSADLYAGDEHEKLQLTSTGKQELPVTGNISWVSTKSKFFAQVIRPNVPTDGGVLTAEVIGDISTESVTTKHTSSVSLAIPADNRVDFDLYLGPVRLTTLSDFDPNAEELVNVGYNWMRFFSVPLVKFVIIPFFEFFGGIIGNYGLVIILFGVAIKLVLYPLTKKSFESAAAMRQLGPEMKAIKEKYKENPQKQQEAIMKLYKTAKVNPLGGCLPNLLQMPILITLWMYFQNSILIRQKSFLWASDLSAPDVLVNLPFNVPFIGDHIGGFVILMAASMILQMQTSGQMASNPQMKFLPYLMPIMLFVFFNNVAAGLSLYYFVYNVVSSAQQMLINRNSIDHGKLMLSIDGKKGKGKSGSK